MKESENELVATPKQNQSIQWPKNDIKSMIYVVRNQQVMIDRDLSALYQVETKRLNESAKRNIL